MVSRRKRVILEETTEFPLNSNNSDCDTSGSFSNEKDDSDCQFKNNDDLEDLQ